MVHKTATSRNSQGSVAELGPVLWFLFLMLTFPLLNLSTVCLRYTFLMSASRDAAEAASTSKTFLTDLSATDQSAINLAQATASAKCASFAGVHLNNVITNLVITDLATNSSTKQATPLTQPADTTKDLYQIEVQVTATVDPLLMYTANNLFGSVPGLTGPSTFTVTSQQICENPDGMNQ